MRTLVLRIPLEIHQGLAEGRKRDMPKHETRGLAQFARERTPRIGCPFGKHYYDQTEKCACGQIKPKRQRHSIPATAKTK
jgi:hypothetical protein